MDFLTICQRTRQECGISGTGPAAVTGQTGELKKIVDWCNTAYEDIQNAHYDFKFMWAPVTFVVDTSGYDYTLASLTDTITSTTLDGIVDHFDPYSFRIYKTSEGLAGQGVLNYMPWKRFRNTYRNGTITTGGPGYFSIQPGGKIALSSTPDVSYTIDADCYKITTAMSANGDTPIFPSRYHMAIVWRAVMYYAGHDEAPALYQDAFNKYTSFLNPLLRHEINHEEVTIIPE